jgi:DNA modification methylase
MTQVPKYQLDYISVSEINPDPRNPRKHSHAQIRALARSIEAFGFNAPILVDKFRKLIAGHARLDAAKLTGLRQVPTICLNNLTETQIRAYMLADNQLAQLSTWDDETLAIHLKELSEIALDFDLEVTGFETAEIDLRIQSLEAPEKSDAADDFQIAQGPPVSQIGDRWTLDAHSIICGDAQDPDIHKSLLQGLQASAAFTDPPYNVKIQGHVSGLGRTKHREFSMAAGEMNTAEFTAFLTTSLKRVQANTAPGGLAYVFMDWRHMGEITTAAQSCGFELINLCVWVKTNGGMGSLYRSQHELVFVFRNGSRAHRNNVQLGRFGRNRTNVWTYPGANIVSRKDTQRLLDLHPTAKPIALIADALLDATKRGEVVIDPFLGSGTTLLAAERTGRRAYGIELDPLYVDTTILRWQRMTGGTARHQSGRPFHELATEWESSHGR